MRPRAMRVAVEEVVDDTLQMRNLPIDYRQ
jgi:hypothetical protein